MKKFIYTVSFLAIALTFTGTSTFAQSTTKIDANIPFEFAIGDQTFEAGKYVMRIRRNSAGAEQIELRDSRNRVVYEGFMLQNGETTSKHPEMIFDRIGGKAVLAKIKLENKGINVPVDKDQNLTLAAKDRKKVAGSSN